MSAMDTESGQPANEDANRGKRKRSPNEPSTNQWSGTVQNPEDRDPGQHSPRTGGVQLPKKLKVEANVLALDSDGDTTIPDDVLDRSLMGLPDQVLQHVLSFLDPFSLARVMCVNRRFSGMLDLRQVPVRSMGLPTRQPSLTPELIWSCSRKSHIPGMPHPLKGVTEFGMFKLVFGKRCQVCGLVPKVSSSKLAATPWNSGPGPGGVRPIWPLKSRLCEKCLRPLLLKEADLAQLGLSELQRGLLSVWFTPSLHYVTSITLGSTPKPPGLSLTKYYFRPQLDELLRLIPDIVTERGAVNLNRRNDLDALRQEAVTDTVRLEAWELSQKADGEATSTSRNMTGRSSASGSSLHSDMRTRSFVTSSSSTYRPYTAVSDVNRTVSLPVSFSSQRLNSGSKMLPPQSEVRATQLSATATGTKSHSLSHHDLSEPSHPLNHKAPVDIAKMKASRRADIESRCMKLNPPLTSQMLQQLPAFQAAIQVLMPLDDSSWEPLKARLLEQKAREENLSSAGMGYHSRASSPGNTTILRIATPPDVHVQDDPRAHAFRSAREKLHEFAGELIRHRYAHGSNLTQSSAPQFAADVLLHVRRRFYENQAREDAAFVANGQQPPDEGPGGARARVLRLEHMKYVFDTSIKPLTEFVRKDLFLCNMCDTQGKHFGFEAIIQHYASKHTNAFSVGTAVVHWKATWPEDPPFHPHPSADKEWLTDHSHLPPGSYAPTSAQSSRSFGAPSSAGIGIEHGNPHFDRDPRGLFDLQQGNFRDRQPHRGSDSFAESNVVPVSQPWPRSYDHATLHPHEQTIHPVYQQPRSAHTLIKQLPYQEPSSNQADPSFPYDIRSHSAGPTPRRGPQEDYRYREVQAPPEFIREYHGPHDDHTASAYIRPFQSTRRHGHLMSYEPAHRFSPLLDEQPGRDAREHRNDFKPDNRGDMMDYQVVPRSPTSRGTVPEVRLNTKHEVEEPFPNALNADGMRRYGRELSEHHYIRESPQLSSSDETYWREITPGRRPNMSQPLRKSRSFIGGDDLQYPVAPSTRAVDVMIPHNRADHRSIGATHLASESDIVYLPGDELPYQTERRAQAASAVVHDPQGYHGSFPVRRETHAVLRQSPPHQYVNRYGRRIEISSPETRYLDGSPPRNIRHDEQRLYSREISALEHQYERQSCEPRTTGVDPQLGSYYVERRTRESLPEPRYVRYERILDGDDVHEDDQSLRHRPSSGRQPSMDQRYRDH